MLLPKLVSLFLVWSFFASTPVIPPHGRLPQQPAAQESPSLAYRYRTEKVEGWTVLFQKELDDKPALQSEVARLLAVKLWEVSSRLPKDVVARLREVPIRMHLDREGCAGGVYHPSAGWLKEHGFPEDWARGVEFGNARNFLGWTRSQPSMVLHELTHAWHHQVLGYDHGGIKEAYERVKASKALEQALYVTGGKKRAYALNNEMEFFAEMSEAWWGTNDYYPFVKVEVMQSFPEMPELLESAWRMP
jgi:hypothetical protein